MAALVGEVPEGEAWAAGLWVAAGWEVVELEAVATAVAGTGVVVAEAWMALAAAAQAVSSAQLVETLVAVMTEGAEKVPELLAVVVTAVAGWGVVEPALEGRAVAL